MKKLIFIFLLVYFTKSYADFIVPKFDPVYEFLEMANTLKLSNLNHLQYPLYMNDVNIALNSISRNRSAGIYRDIATYHQRRLALNYDLGIQIAVYPATKIPNSITDIFKNHTQHNRLITITEKSKNNLNIVYISGILGYNYDVKLIDDDDFNRTRRYYGIESVGSFTENFGYYFQFKKGHYFGNEDFIKENPYLSWMDYGVYQDGNRFYQVDLNIELDFKNPFLNISMGYGSFDIGRTISSSIILNSDVTPYGYFKFNKRFNIFEYNGITSQLIPYRRTEPEEYKSKSMAIQTIALNTNQISLGVGNSIIYGDRTIDIAYSTPLAIYKIMDNKFHGVDNGLAFAFTEYRPISGLNIYANILLDDLTKSRFSTENWTSFTAFQGGVITQLSFLPVEIGGEITTVGPSTYAHKSQHLTYQQDDMMLGNINGSNFLNIAARTRIHFARCSVLFYYENIQQGDRGNLLSDNFIQGEAKFLAGNFERKELFRTGLDIRLIPELYLFVNYDYSMTDKETHYIFTGAEFKY